MSKQYVIKQKGRAEPQWLARKDFESIWTSSRLDAYHYESREIADRVAQVFGGEVWEVERIEAKPENLPRAALLAMIAEQAAALTAAAERERVLREALEGLLLSADAAWEGGGGHDWHEACEAARAALEATP